MRRRITLSILGSVAAALLLVGLGTLALIRASARSVAADELADQTAATAELLKLANTELNRVMPPNAPPLARQREQRRRIQGLADNLDVEGLGFLTLDLNGRVLAELSDPVPAGVDVAQLDPVALRQGDVVSGGRGDRVWSAAAIIDRPGVVVPVVVLTRSVDPVPGPSIRWFALASLLTLLVAALVASRLGRALARPVLEAQAATSRIAQGDLSVRVPIARRDRGSGDELEALAEAINAMATSLERSRGLERQFLLSVSHDLRTPLTSIRGYAEAIADGTAPDATTAAAVILGESRRLERLVADLLDLAKLDARRFTLRPVELDLVELAADSVDGFRREVEGAGLAIELQAPTTPVPVVVDPDRLQQVVANLVENALKFARRRLEVRVVVDDPAWPRLEVSDDGPGIAAEDLPHVFERLYVAAATPERKEAGSGLGLAIAKELTEAMGGRVDARVDTVDGVVFGTSMAVTLPAARTAPDTSPDAGAGASAAQPPTSGSGRTSAET